MKIGDGEDLPPGPQAAEAPHVSYPLVLRNSGYAWWKPVMGGLLMFVGVLIVVPVVLMPVLAIAVTLQGCKGSFTDRIAASMQVDQVTPSSMLYLNLTLASLTVLAMLIVRRVHGLSPRWLASVLPGMRWKFFFACLGLGVIALAVSQAVQALLPGDPTENPGQAELPTGQLLATAIVILLTTPLQALGEEYGFRGYLMQAFGSFFRSRAVALVMTSLAVRTRARSPERTAVLRPVGIRSYRGAGGDPARRTRGWYRDAHLEQPRRLRCRDRVRAGRRHPQRRRGVVVADTSHRCAERSVSLPRPRSGAPGDHLERHPRLQPAKSRAGAWAASSRRRWLHRVTRKSAESPPEKGRG